MARLEDLALEGLATADGVAHPLFRLTRDADCGQLPGAVESRQLARVALVVFPLDSRSLGDERRSDDLARDAPLAEGAVEDIAGATRLVADPQGPALGESLELALELRQVVRKAIHVSRGLRRSREDGEGDGLLVHVHPDEDD